MGFVGCIPRFLKAHGGWVLTALGIGGFGATVMLTAKEAPEVHTEIARQNAIKAMEAYEEEGLNLATDDIPSFFKEHSLTRAEKFKIGLKHYWPAILTGGAAAGCMIGSQIFNVKKQTALLGTIAAMSTQFDQYRQAVRAEHGDDADRRAFEISQMKIKEMQEEIERLKEENGPYLYGIVTLPGVVFEAKPVDIQEALYHYNRNLVLRGEADFDELYRFIGIPDTAYDEAQASSFGYNQYQSEVEYGVGYADFQIVSIVAQNGRMIHMIDPAFPPYRIGWVNTDDKSGADIGDPYPDYNEIRERSLNLAKNILESNQLTKINHPNIYAENQYFL